MRKQHLIGLMSIVMLTTACGKGMQVTAKAPAPGADKNLTTSQNVSTIANTPGATNGALLPFSSYDMTALQSNLLYLDADDKDNAIRAVGSPGFMKDGTQDTREGWVKNSNVVFRAIVPVPQTVDGIKGVTKFKLLLRGVRVFNASGSKLEDTLGKQVLCLVEPGKEKCAGGKIDLSDKNINGVWKSAQQNEYSFGASSLFKKMYTLENESEVYGFVGDASTKTVTETFVDPHSPATPAPDKNAPGVTMTHVPELEIDIQKAFGVADKDLPQWILDNSTVYDSTKNYRKFRFELANNIYAREGELDLAVVTDSGSLIAGAAGTAVNGDSDVNKDSDLKTGIKVDDADFVSARVLSKQLNETEFSFDLAADKVSEKISDASLAKLNALAPLLIKDAELLEEIQVVAKVEAGSDKVAAEKTAQNRAKLIETALSGLSVKTSIKVEGAVVDQEKDRVLELNVVLNKTSTSDQIDTVNADLNQGLGISQ